MKEQIPKKTTLITGYSCNNRCRFCIYAHKKTIADKTTQQLFKEMSAAREQGGEHLVFVGGEPFIRGDIIDLIKEAKNLGFKNIIAATNGRMFAYKGFAKKVVDAGLTELYFSIHGHNARLHDSLTRVKGSFDQALLGLHHVRRAGLGNLGTHTTIVKPNYRHLPQIGRFLYGLGIKSADFVFVDPNYGGAYENFDELVPCLSEVVPYVKKALDFVQGKLIDHWAVRYIPVCLLKGYDHYVSDIKDLKKVHTEHIGPDFIDLHVEKTRRESWRMKSERCSPCQHFYDCEGIWKEYERRLGDTELESVL
jgi:MoaA/NifB/PqqE/SkfB family radical SAM enzyme